MLNFVVPSKRGWVASFTPHFERFLQGQIVKSVDCDEDALDHLRGSNCSSMFYHQSPDPRGPPDPWGPPDQILRGHYQRRSSMEISGEIIIFSVTRRSRSDESHSLSEWVSEWVSQWVIVSIDFTDVTLVSDDTYRKLHWCDPDHSDDPDESYLVMKVI